MKIDLKFSYNAEVNEYIIIELPKYEDKGFIPVENTITCEIYDNSNLNRDYICYSY